MRPPGSRDLSSSKTAWISASFAAAWPSSVLYGTITVLMGHLDETANEGTEKMRERMRFWGAQQSLLNPRRE